MLAEHLVDMVAPGPRETHDEDWRFDRLVFDFRMAFEQIRQPQTCPQEPANVVMKAVAPEHVIQPFRARFFDETLQGLLKAPVAEVRESATPGHLLEQGLRVEGKEPIGPWPEGLICDARREPQARQGFRRLGC